MPLFSSPPKYQPGRKITLTALQQQELAKAIVKDEGFLKRLRESWGAKLRVATRQPVEFALYYALSNYIPFVDDASFAKVVDTISRTVLKNRAGFKGPVIYSPAMKAMLKREAVRSFGDALEQNPELHEFLINHSRKLGGWARPELRSLHPNPVRFPELRAKSQTARQALERKLIAQQLLASRRSIIKRSRTPPSLNVRSLRRQGEA